MSRFLDLAADGPLLFILDLTLIVATLALPLVGFFSLGASPPPAYPALPVPPALGYSVYRTGPLAVAAVFGRSSGCVDAGPDLIFLVAREAARAGLDPAVLAATLAMESGCDQYAVSARGAVGYTQVMPRVWRARYDLAGRYNLLNAADNVRVGAMILGDLTRAHGLDEGLRRYQGTGRGCATCDGRYTSKILSLARVRP